MTVDGADVVGRRNSRRSVSLGRRIAINALGTELMPVQRRVDVDVCTEAVVGYFQAAIGRETCDFNRFGEAAAPSEIDLHDVDPPLIHKIEKRLSLLSDSPAAICTGLVS